MFPVDAQFVVIAVKKHCNYYNKTNSSKKRAAGQIVCSGSALAYPAVVRKTMEGDGSFSFETCGSLVGSKSDRYFCVSSFLGLRRR